MSERLRRLCCLTGQAEVYSQASELLKAIGDIDIPGMQIQRLCTHYGSLIEPLIEDDCMQYKTYREQGLLIGSGPIEAAHRNVIQQRMKRSGQKWSLDGAQALANLRCYRCSQSWDSIEKIIAAA